jgi:hypothetical protein
VKAAPLQLPDGRALEERRGAWIIKPPGITVAVAETDDGILVTDPDTGSVVYQGPVAAGAGGSRPPAAGKPATPPSRPAAGGGRWQTFNEFVDVIGPRLTLAEREVWHVMFRHARGGVVETTARNLATACRINKATVVRAHARLEVVGLIWPIWKSLDRSRPSKYGINPMPAACLAKLEAPPRPGARRRPRRSPK